MEKKGVITVDNNQIEFNANEQLKEKKFTGLKIVWAVIFIAITAWMIWGLADVLASKGQKGWGIGLALYLTLIVMVFGSIGYVIDIIIAIVGVVLSVRNLNETTSKKTLISFIVMAVLPIVVEATLIITCKLLA